MSNTNTEVLTTAYENLQGALTQANTVLPPLQEAIEKGNLDNYATVSQLEEKANEVDLEVERKRIDSFTKLAEGSTTGDAELVDGRVGADGITYSNIGNAIRGQINDVNNDLDDLNSLLIQAKSIIDKCTIYNGEYWANALSSGTSLNKFPNSDYYCLLIPVKGGKKYTFYNASSITLAFNYFAKNNKVVRNLTKDDYTIDAGKLIITVPNDVNQIALTPNPDTTTTTYNTCNVIEGIVDFIPTLSAMPVGEKKLNLYTKNEINKIINKEYNTNYVYVSKTGSDITGNGTKDSPFATLYHAYETITDNSYTNRYTIIVGDGTYTDLQEKYSGTVGTDYQGIGVREYISVKSESGDATKCIFEWDGATGLDTFTAADATYKCFFHCGNGSKGITIEGIKFVGKNLRYCMHVETNTMTDVKFYKCIFDWGGLPNASDNPHNRPVIGIGASLENHLIFEKCKFYNSENTCGIQTHDNAEYLTGEFATGQVIECIDCYFDNLNIQVRSGNYERNMPFSLELKRCGGLNTVYPTLISGGTKNYWRGHVENCFIIDDKLSNSTNDTTYNEISSLK